jgi:uncharacterized protein (DUF433 family)
MRASDVLDACASCVGIDEELADFRYLSQEDITACRAFGAHAVDHAVAQVA